MVLLFFAKYLRIIRLKKKQTDKVQKRPYRRLNGRFLEENEAVFSEKILKNPNGNQSFVPEKGRSFLPESLVYLNYAAASGNEKGHSPAGDFAVKAQRIAVGDEERQLRLIPEDIAPHRRFFRLQHVWRVRHNQVELAEIRRHRTENVGLNEGRRFLGSGFASSVSGRGINTAGVTWKTRPQNSVRPITYCMGSPSESLSMADSSTRSFSGAMTVSGSIMCV